MTCIVTIGIPFLNARRYLADAVRSVFAQPFTACAFNVQPGAEYNRRERRRWPLRPDACSARSTRGG